MMSGLGKQIEICISFFILHEEMINFHESAPSTYDENNHAMIFLFVYYLICLL
jgi:hypothetical protein